MLAPGVGCARVCSNRKTSTPARTAIRLLKVDHVSSNREWPARTDHDLAVPSRILQGPGYPCLDNPALNRIIRSLDLLDSRR